MPKPYDRGDPPQRTEEVLRFLREELQRIEAFTHYPQTDGSWEDLRFPATAVGAGATAPTWDSTNIGYAFSSVQDNSVQVIAQMPHAWREGTNIRPHVHWEAGTGFSVGTAVVWAMSYRWRNNGETAGAMTVITVTVTPTATLVLRSTDFGELNGTGKDISSILDIQITRLAASSAADNMGATAILKEFDIHYLVDSMGSDLERKK
jgi:hypothetical protein